MTVCLGLENLISTQLGHYHIRHSVIVDIDKGRGQVTPELVSGLPRTKVDMRLFGQTVVVINREAAIPIVYIKVCSDVVSTGTFNLNIHISIVINIYRRAFFDAHIAATKRAANTIALI